MVAMVTQLSPQPLFGLAMGNPFLFTGRRYTAEDCNGNPARPGSSATRLIRRALLLGLSAWLMVTSLTGVADARIKPPRLEELIDSADLIVVGNVNAVGATPPVLWRRVGIAGVGIPSAVLLVFLL